MWKIALACCLCLICVATSTAQSVPEFQWRAVEIDQIEIGYGLKIADVDGDGKSDVVLADKSTVQWYQNPGWQKHIIARDLTERDNVCVAARDIDGDGKCEIAVGGQWNFRESVKDGAVFYLHPPADRTQLWTPVQLHHEPSVHRMHWVRTGEDEFHLVVKPLRGRGSIDGEGPGLRILAYAMPDDPTSAWEFHPLSSSLHLSHNFHPINWDDDPEEELLVAAKEGVWLLDKQADGWTERPLTENFAGEIRDGQLPGGRRFIATIEPMHGSTAAVYAQGDDPNELWQRVKVLDEAIKDGHALACADFLGVGYDQVLVGWRAMNEPGVPGIKLFTPLDSSGSQWRETVVSAGDVAVEDMKAADLDGDGKVDIIAAARQTKNLVIFFNQVSRDQ